MDANTLSYYASQSPITDPGAMSGLFDGLPADIDVLAGVAHGLVIHFRMEDPLAVGITEERLGEIDGRYAETMLARLAELDARPLQDRRPPEHRMVGCCRDFTVLFLAMARALGIPARARAGFAAYFFDDVSIDHEVAEVWDEPAGRWRVVDAQLREEHPGDGQPFSRTDVPGDLFMTAGTAWRRCRAGEVDPKTFVVHPDLELEMARGLPYISHNLVLDLAALNKAEMLLWDVWGLGGKGLSWKSVTKEQLELLDEVARVTVSGDLAEAQRLYASEPLLTVPERVTSISPITMRPRQVALRSEAATS